MKIGILISGRGSNMAAITGAVRNGEIPDSEIAVVVSDREDAAGIERSREFGNETIVIPRLGRSRAEHDADIASALREQDVELICLAGYMRLLSPEFVRAFPDRILNIHPSLLPSFAGLGVQQQAIDYGVQFTGCTVHFVDEELDHGPIVVQTVVAVADDDTAAALSDRILAVEHSTYIEAIRRVVSGEYMFEGRRYIRRAQ